MQRANSGSSGSRKSIPQKAAGPSAGQAAGYAADGTSRLGRNVRLSRRCLGNPAAALEPSRWAAVNGSGRRFLVDKSNMRPILLDIPERLDTERLLISVYENGDGEEFFQLIRSNYNYLQEELGEVQAIKSIEDAEEYIRHKRIAWLSKERLVPKVVEKSTGRMVGQLWIEPQWDRMIFELGYFVEEKSQGKGYVTEAVKRTIEFLFRELGANRLEIHTKATNSKSIGVAERCGFSKEAQLRERGRTNEGEVVDMQIFGLLRSEFS